MRAAADPELAWRHWRQTRDELFRSHPQSPLPAEARARFRGLDYFPYDPAYRVVAELEPVEAEPEPIETSGAEPLRFRPVARASFALHGERAELDVHWLDAYGGGLFLPVRDATSGATSYGGGRYVLDTVKGADLGADGDRLIVDFNFAYNPSCAYEEAGSAVGKAGGARPAERAPGAHGGWVCPLAPPGNRLSGAVEAGERAPR